MRTKDADKSTDWNDALREDSAYEPRLSHATTYCYKTKCNETLFKFGVTDVSWDDSADGVVGQLVGDSVDTRNVRMFIDYEKFSNPFFRSSAVKEESKYSMKHLKSNFLDRPRTDKPTASFDTSYSSRSLFDLKRPAFQIHAKLLGDLPVEAPKDFPSQKTKSNSETIIQKKTPVVLDSRHPIEPGTYYMYEMVQAVNNDPTLDPKISSSFKTHVVQNYQNLQEVMSAKLSEKPLANPLKPELPVTLGKMPSSDKSKLLVVLDIDETLVHVVRSHEKLSHEHILKVGRPGSAPVDIKLNLRPFAREFLANLRESCNLALMTASHKTYADQVYAFLDPTKSILKGVFSKDHCVNFTKGR